MLVLRSAERLKRRRSGRQQSKEVESTTKEVSNESLEPRSPTITLSKI